MSTPPPIARRFLVRARSLARRIVPVSYQGLDPIRSHLREIEAQQHEHLEHIRNLAHRIEELNARLDALEGNLNGRLDDLAERSETTIALGWDHVALVRRLAAIEDRLVALDVAGLDEESPRALAG